MEVVENGQEAVNRSAERAFDVILMDMQVSVHGLVDPSLEPIEEPYLTPPFWLFSQMPVMDGLEATRIIVDRQRRQGRSDGMQHPKIVFLTAHALASFQDEAADAGADHFLSKPCKMDDIRSMLEHLDLIARTSANVAA